MMPCVWGGRWGVYFKIKKKMHDWYNAGIPMEEIIRRVYTMQFSDPVVLEVVEND